MELQLYMWSGIREAALRRHDFYLEQAKRRLVGQFEDIDGEATQFADDLFERYASSPGDDEGDLGGFAEQATEAGYEHYDQLVTLRNNVILSTLAGLYHQWEKELRAFIEHELKRDVQPKTIEDIWRRNISDIFELLSQFGWKVEDEPFFKMLDACRLVVNAYKHGKGQAMVQLYHKHPKYLRGLYPGVHDILPKEFVELEHIEHDWLALTEEQMDELAASIRQFWGAFPERLFLALPSSQPIESKAK